MKKFWGALIIALLIGVIVGVILAGQKKGNTSIINGKYRAVHACVYMGQVRVSSNGQNGTGYNISCVCRLERVSDGALSEWIDAVGITMRAGVCWDKEKPCEDKLAEMKTNLKSDCDSMCPTICDSMMRNALFGRTPDYQPVFTE